MTNLNVTETDNGAHESQFLEIVMVYYSDYYG